jgi:RNA polymerase sigma factor (sigma-70 family)
MNAMPSATLLETDVRLAMTGDRDAYALIVEQSANVVCAIALAIVRNVQASEDVAQEVFLAVWTSLGKLRNPASFLPWLRQLTRNQANLWIRNHARERSDDDALAAAADARPTPADSLLRDEERRVLADVIADLPEESREVVILYYREGSSAKHVAGLLGISEDAVKQRLSRARTKIRAEMLQRFGGTLARTAPGAAFVTAVGTALTAAAPPASAAIAGATAAKSAGGVALSVIAKSSAIGAIGGIVGVLMGFTHLGEPFDDEEAAELRTFKRIAIAVVIVASIAFAAADHHRIWMITTYFTFMAVLLYLNLVRLPKILARRMAWEREVNPELAKKHRLVQFYGLAGQMVGAIMGGLTLLFLLPTLFR